MAGPHLPLALLCIFGVPCRDLSIAPAANGGRRLIHSDLARHFLQVCVIRCEVVTKRVHGDAFQKGRIAPFNGSLIVMTTLPKEFPVERIRGFDRTPEKLLGWQTCYRDRENRHLLHQFGSFACRTIVLEACCLSFKVLLVLSR